MMFPTAMRLPSTPTPPLVWMLPWVCMVPTIVPSGRPWFATSVTVAWSIESTSKCPAALMSPATSTLPVSE